MKNYKLIPFDPQSPYEISVNLQQTQHHTILTYQIKNLSDISTCSKSLIPGKKLWLQNCLELFWQEDNSTHYKELNISFNGKWNIYQFSDYRNNMQDVTHNYQGNISYQKLQKYTTITITLPLLTIMHLQIAAIFYLQNSTYYYALAHHHPQPDFHQLSLFQSLNDKNFITAVANNKKIP